MFKLIYKIRKPFILFPLTLCLTLLLCLPWVSAKETPKPKPQDWQMDGIVAALDDSYSKVKEYAFDKLAEYDAQELKAVLKKLEDIALKAVNILKDEKVDLSIRRYAASALGKLGEAGAKYAPDIANILKDEKVYSSIRRSAASALGNLGEAGAKYAPDIANILKDEKVNSYIRSSAAEALGNLGEAGAKYAPDILNFLKDEKVDSSIRSSAAEALGNLGEAGAKYALDILNFLKDEKVDSDIRSSAASALGNLGEAGAKYAPDIANILKDEKVNSSIRSSAAEALSNLGEAGAKYAPDILNFLKDEKVDSDIRSRAAEALGNLGEAGAKYAPDIANILKDEKVDSSIRGSAAEALSNLGEAGAKYAPDILNFLKDEKVDKYIRSNAAEALGNLGEAGAKYAPDIANILKDEKVNSSIRSSAAEALSNLGEAGAKYAPDILNFLKDEKVDSDIRSRAAEALGNLGEAGAKYAPDIANILKDEKVDSSIRGSAAEALSNLGEAGAKYAPDILNFLKEEMVNLLFGSRAREALGNLGEAGAKYAPDILNFLKDEKVDSYIRRSAAEALGNIRKLELKEVIIVLNNVYQPNQSDFEKLRFLTYFLSGGTDEVKTLLTWLGIPQEIPTQLKYEDGKKTLEVFLSIWQDSNDLKRLQKDLADKIADVTSLVTWKPQDITLLQSHYHNLKKAEYNQSDTVESAINNLAVWQWIFNARNTIIIHATFWFTLIFLYPKSPQIQAIFFWNPWVRKILGIGYVGLFLTWIPFLRRKLFEPFKPSLLADAKLDYFNDKIYFPESQVKIPISDETLPITQALPTIKGQLVLFGDSGLGKSMFLRHLVKNSPRIVVYLPARKCDDGVIEAIQTKLHGQAQDAEFLKNLIYSGAIDICIDGLNEVSADTRAKITNFVEHYFRGNIIMTTQPLEWIPPATAKSYWLQPLESQQIEEFLVSRAEGFSQDTKIKDISHKSQKGEALANKNSDLPTNSVAPMLHPYNTTQTQNTNYKEACINYLKEALNRQQAREELAAAQRILSNPMDLTLISLMLSQGKQPNLFRLQEEQYKLMTAEYRKEWHKEFPLKKFSESVYEMRIKDEEVIPVDGFDQVLMSLADDKYKMVVSRQWQDEAGEAKKEYLFRHDKIMDFFLVQNFLGKGDEVQQLQVKHINDSRFRGVYFLLATFLPVDDAKELREILIQYAADTKDHTVSDTFVQLLRTR